MLMYYSQPRMATPSKYLQVNNPSKHLKPRPLEVVHIPIDVLRGEPFARLEKVGLINIGDGGIPENKCNDFEKELGWIPELRSFKNFSWTHRSLLGISNESMPHLTGHWKADYRVYVWMDEPDNCGRYLHEPDSLGRNHTLEDIAEFDVKSCKESLLKFKIRGDAFVFKRVKEHGSEGSLRGYVDMDEGFVDSLNDEKDAYSILRELLLHPARRG